VLDAVCKFFVIKNGLRLGFSQPKKTNVYWKKGRSVYREWTEPSKSFASWESIAQRASRALDRSSEFLQFGEETLRYIAHFNGAGSLPVAVIRQAAYEQWVRIWKHSRFRSRSAEALEAYCALSLSEFEGINARQQWANWRVIPRNLNGRLPNCPVRAVDLCCGIGQSTSVLACYCAPGSHILGLEYNHEFTKVAQQRKYLDDTGRRARVSFHAQSVLEMFFDGQGNLISDASIDLVNSCGAVGCHFEPSATAVLAKEIARVLKAGGLALIDSGSAGTETPELIRIFEAQQFRAVHSARSCALDRYTQVCFKKR
jgi:SAM-dependent methyltransferase